MVSLSLEDNTCTLSESLLIFHSGLEVIGDFNYVSHLELSLSFHIWIFIDVINIHS